MELGILTAPFPDRSLDEVADWAAARGFSQLEVCAWPSEAGETRRYGGICHLDVEDLSPTHASEIVDGLAGRGITISGLGYYPNPLHPDETQRTAVQAHLREVITAAATLGVGVVNTFIGADRSRTQQENWAAAKEVWPDLVEHASEQGVRIAIENCPMLFSGDEWPSGHNLAYSPSMWRTMFEEFGETVGLNFDPSHLVWQFIDVERTIAEFGPRFYHFHAKDLMIDREGLYEHGIMSGGRGWQVPRLPGLGDLDWQRIFRSLYHVGYDGVICIEHEDRDFEGTDELVERGFLLARDHLAPWVR